MARTERNGHRPGTNVGGGVSVTDPPHTKTSTKATSGSSGVPVAPPPKLRRRPLMVLGGLILVVLGALVAVWVWLATSDTTEVLAVRETVMRGDEITAEDLVTVQVGADPALQVVPAGEKAEVVGVRAARDMSAGSLSTREAVTELALPQTGSAVVGLALTPALMPGDALLVGDAVRVVTTAGPQGDPSTVSEEFGFDAEIVRVVPTTQTGKRWSRWSSRQPTPRTWPGGPPAAGSR